MEGYEIFTQWLNFSSYVFYGAELKDLAEGDIIYLDFPWLTTAEIMEIVQKLDERNAIVYYISAKEIDEYPPIEDESGASYSLEEFWNECSENIMFYKLQTNEFYNFLADSAKEIVSLFDKNLDNMTFFFDASMIGTFKDSWKDRQTMDKFAGAAPDFYTFVKRIAKEAGYYYDDMQTIMDEFSTHDIEIYLYIEEDTFVRLSRFFDSVK